MIERKKNTSPKAPSTEGRQLVLDTAARLFREEGYASISLRDIAAEAGMKAASLYHHFASKDAIVGEVLRIGVERVADEVKRCVMALPDDVDAPTLLLTAVHAHLRALHQLQDYTSANIRIFGQVPAHVREAHLPERDAYERYWASLFQRCAQQGELDTRRDHQLARLFLIAALNGTLDWFKGGAAALQAIAEELTALLLCGLGRHTPAR
ncbi:TetR/AcrR family transcriptional regulator [Tepidicella baoligensis]|uniref:TetR/AcrR family transcriptional regulator n=1 Tax=Tepidicella baoligensis TaxID=2707016 RepID=UPI0015DB61EA|nr:TetR/AcrR family transcriptional regulator [Tepidicella baoligensis]